MEVISQRQLDSLKAFIDNHESFIIAGHKEPDGDCISSCLGISYLLTKLNKPFYMVNAGPFKRPEIKKYAALFNTELPFMTQSERDECGLIITDCSEISRIGEVDGDFNGFDTFIIDHHKTADVSGENTIIDPTTPAAACLIQQIYESLVGPLSKEEATVLFTGLATDTGYFRFLTENSSEVFKQASRLVEYGANPKEVYSIISGGKAWNTRKLLGIMLERAERHCNGKLVITWETIEDTRKYGQEGRDSDALYSSMLAVDGVEVVIFIRQETEHSCTAGFRSKDKYDVSQVAAKFGGGGHKNAAGTCIEGRLETVIPSVIKEFSKIL